MIYFENDMFPASLINSCHTPPSPPPLPTLPAPLTPYPLACLPHCLPHFPTSFTHSIPPSPWFSYITLCLTDSPVSLPLPHLLPHSVSFTPLHCSASPNPFSLPCLPHSHFLHSVIASLSPPFPALLSPSITPLPPSFTFSSLSHCLTFPSLSCLTLSLNHSPASLIHFFFTQSLSHYPLTHSCPTLSLNHSLLLHLLPLLLYFHSLPDSLIPLHPHLLTLTPPNSLTPSHSLLFLTLCLTPCFIHSPASLFAAPNPFSLPCLPHSLFHHSVIASLSPP